MIVTRALSRGQVWSFEVNCEFPRSNNEIIINKVPLQPHTLLDVNHLSFLVYLYRSVRLHRSSILPSVLPVEIGIFDQLFLRIPPWHPRKIQGRR